LNVKTLFFDVGDTLVHRGERVTDSVITACRRLGIPVSPPPGIYDRVQAWYDAHRMAYSTAEGIHDFVPRYLRAILRMIGARGVSRAAFGEIHDYTDYLGTSHYAPFPETLEVLEAARAAFGAIAVVSNWNVYLESFLENLGLRNYFEFVIVSDVVGAWKPDPRIFRIALERAGIGPDEVFYIGNSYREDVLGARAAGIETLFISRNGDGPPDCQSFPDLRAALAAARSRI
jgi:putative hydrolase of the HAD superfamily